MHLYWKIRNGLYSNSPAMSMHIVWNIFYKFDCKWLHDIFVNLCMTIHIMVCSSWYRLYILLLSICWNLLINGWEYEEILNQMSLYELKVVRSLFIVIKYRTVTCENEPWKSCHFFDWFTCFLYKMRLFMNDVLFIMLTQIIDND